ncbi:VWA domain-containing protein [Candidatus Kaiserbacteria bacterium]|nr:VWA domain-containing protein [Candidatus Kaiserbacteria bacterium]
MSIRRPWAFWRRTQYVLGILFLVILVGAGSFFSLRGPATCFDGKQNGDETGVDCGGSCTRVCSFEVSQPTTQWARAFEIAPGRYNAVAYVENANQGVGTPRFSYTFKLYDADGVIVERKGETILPPNSVYPVFEGRINTGLRKPTHTVIEYEQPELWLPASSGREQFRISNRELSDVGTLPRLTASMQNTGVSDASNVEVVATIFDSKGNALTASQTVVEALPARGTETVTFTWPNPIAGTLRSCEIPTDVVLAIDLSGSMNNDGGDPPEPISSVISSAESFIARLNTGDQVGIVTYASSATIAQSLTSQKNAARTVVRSLEISPSEEQGTTNTGDALYRAKDILTSDAHSMDARMVTVLLTDGLATAPGEDPEMYAQEAANALKEEGVSLFTIGLGGNVNESFLTSIASSESHYFKAASAVTIDQIYRSVTSAICEDGPAIIEIIPKTGTFAPLE